MNEMTEQLIKKYPKLLKVNKPAKHPWDQWGIEFYKGWLPLFDELCGKIQEYVDKNNLPQPTIVQAKQKLSLLTTYWDNMDESMYKLIDEYEIRSLDYCEKCGANENVTTNDIKEGYMWTLCDDCRNKKNNYETK